jgi:hypothetical protein
MPNVIDPIPATPDLPIAPAKGANPTEETFTQRYFFIALIYFVNHLLTLFGGIGNRYCQENDSIARPYAPQILT